MKRTSSESAATLKSTQANNSQNETKCCILTTFPRIVRSWIFDDGGGLPRDASRDLTRPHPYALTGCPCPCTCRKHHSLRMQGCRLSAIPRKASKTVIKAIGKALLTAALLSASGSAAQATYLTCDIPVVTGNTRHFEFTLDEGKGTVSWVDNAPHVREDGTVRQLKAIFTHDSVTWADRYWYPPNEDRFTISRVDLTITFSRIWVQDTRPPNWSGDFTRVGKCSIVDAPRKF